MRFTFEIYKKEWWLCLDLQRVARITNRCAVEELEAVLKDLETARGELRRLGAEARDYLGGYQVIEPFIYPDADDARRPHDPKCWCAEKCLPARIREAQYAIYGTTESARNLVDAPEDPAYEAGIQTPEMKTFAQIMNDSDSECSCGIKADDFGRVTYFKRSEADDIVSNFAVTLVQSRTYDTGDVITVEQGNGTSAEVELAHDPKCWCAEKCLPIKVEAARQDVHGLHARAGRKRCRGSVCRS